MAFHLYFWLLPNMHLLLLVHNIIKGPFLLSGNILLHLCLSLSANSNSLNLLCLSEFAVCDNFFEVKMNFEMNFQIKLAASLPGTHHLGQTWQVKHQ